MSLVFDTLKLSKSLGRAFTSEQAEVLTEALAVNINESLATKADLAVMGAELKAEIATLETKLTGEIAALDTRLIGSIAALDTKLTNRIAAVDAALANTRAELIRWIVTSFVGNVITMVTIAIAIVKLVGPR